MLAAIYFGESPNIHIIVYLDLASLMPMSITLLSFIYSLSFELQNISNIVAIEEKTHGKNDSPQ
jgi:hypothetical protein